MSTLDNRELLCTVLRFFVYPAERKAEYLSVIPANSAIFAREEDEPFVSPHHAFVVIAIDVLENYQAACSAGERGEWEVVRDMVCVLLMMNDLSDQEYFWFLDKDAHPTSGPHDNAWLVLARLSKIALEKFGWSADGLMVNFEEILRSRGLVVRPN